MVLITARSGLPYWGPLGSMAETAPQALARTVLSKTARLGSRIAHVAGDRNLALLGSMVLACTLR